MFVFLREAQIFFFASQPATKAPRTQALSDVM
jgi:hypothetical protein